MKLTSFFSLRTVLLSLLILPSFNHHAAHGMDKVCNQTLSNQSIERSITPIYSEDKGELLDLFGVVLQIDKDLANQEGRKIGPNFDAERTMCSPLWPKLDLGTVTAEEVALSISSNEQDYKATLNFIKNIRRYIKPNRIGMEIFKAIKQENPGHKIHILSNLSIYCITGTCEKPSPENEYTNIFDDGAIFSCTIGITKPDKRIFEYALKTFNLDAQPVYFTDDTLKNLKGALNAGLYPISAQCHSVWYFTCIWLGRISRNANIEKLLHASEPKEFEFFKNCELNELQNFDQIAVDLEKIRTQIDG